MIDLRQELAFIMANDPSAKSVWEIFFCYPGFHALLLHRVAHWLYEAKQYFWARCVSQLTRHLTGIEIHPGARIADRVFIDHGLGVVIGETAEIESEVIIYQGVTLGGTSRKPGKRHPTIKSGALIGAHAQVLGNISVGERARVGAGSVVFADVPAGCTVLGVPARVVSKVSPVDPLSHHEIPDFILEKLKRLEGDLEQLKGKGKTSGE